MHQGMFHLRNVVGLEELLEFIKQFNLCKLRMMTIILATVHYFGFLQTML
jgi:hypothetical protein